MANCVGLGLVAGLSQGDTWDWMVFWVEGRYEAVNAFSGHGMKKA